MHTTPPRKGFTHEHLDVLEELRRISRKYETPSDRTRRALRETEAWLQKRLRL